jgi:hypothetical protein
LKLVECPSCKGVNRLQKFQVSQQAICGRCRAPLPGPSWVGLARASKRNAAWIAVGALVLVGVTRPFEAWKPPQQAATPASASVPGTKPWELQWTDDKAAKAPAAPEPLPKAAPAPVGTVVQSARVLHNYRPNATKAPFALTTSAGTGGYYFKLVDVQTGQTVFAGLVPSGGRYEFKVPVGDYKLRYATGPGWLDEQRYFGDETSYNEGGSTLSFYREADGVSGHQVELIRQRGGNFATHRMSAASF